MRYDAVIIGFGKAGKTLAGALAGKGKKVALIEKSRQMYGGTCINVGCIPSKSLVTSAALAAKNIGSFAEAVDEKTRVTTMLRKKNYDKLDQLENVTIYDGTASFLSDRAIQVLTETEKLVLESEKIFINTGSEPVIPPIDGIKDNPKVYTSETLMDQRELPKNLVLIGAGYIGMEFASMFRNFGSKVTVLQDGDVFLPREDRDVAAKIQEILEKRGIEFRFGAKIQRIEGGDVIFQYQGKENRLEADAILLATGRRPNVKELHVENAGIELTSRQAVMTDELMRTNVPGIWAMGDVTGGLQFTYTSLDDYRVVLPQLLDSSTADAHTLKKRKNVPYSVFMDTPYSKVGLNEMEAQKQGIPYRVNVMPAAAIPKAQVLKKTDGYLKALVHGQTGEILGAMLLCEESYEMINIVKLAMDYHADASVLKNQIFTHPTMSEALNDLFGGF
ncbi:MAG: pyridine nucleotide-disulfide oxidoreductase [Clostridia bacterium]|nr:pyridine nucleotide-disulfide oxidoreductase [Clostridia bacterium]NCC42600.1 pyridine nucleotide-disulfide oxidoreductase [Clostridia bacterium]